MTCDIYSFGLIEPTRVFGSFLEVANSIESGAQQSNTFCCFESATGLPVAIQIDHIQKISEVSDEPVIGG